MWGSPGESRKNKWRFRACEQCHISVVEREAAQAREREDAEERARQEKEAAEALAGEKAKYFRHNQDITHGMCDEWENTSVQFESFITSKIYKQYKA